MDVLEKRFDLINGDFEDFRYERIDDIELDLPQKKLEGVVLRYINAGPTGRLQTKELVINAVDDRHEMKFDECINDLGIVSMF